jgi:hypothetical protein
METEETGRTQSIFNLTPVFRRVLLENFQVAIVGFLYILIKTAHLRCIAFSSTCAILRTSHNRWKGNRFNFSHLAIALADCDFFHDVFSFVVVLLFISIDIVS